MKLKAILSAMLLSLVLAGAVSAQESLTNEGVVKLVKSGMSEDLIQNVIRTQPANFSLGAADLVALKEAGVSERIITAMVNKTSGGGGGGTTASGAALPAMRAASVGQPGLYYRKNNEMLELIHEDISWKTSGALKSVASAGIVKKDLKGTITGPSSRNFLTNPMEIIISPPTGVTINDYILLPMKAGKGLREFEVGPVNQKSGVAKGAIPFGAEKLGDNAFRMVLQTPLGPGEYGILVTKAIGGIAGATRMFTFRILL